ncbi:MAG: endonuclease MutS2 [Clostridiales bacterium]|nr:endonuclease MutS2 [Clostridiales bacterium]
MKSIQTLEFNTIRALCAVHTVSEPGEELILSLLPVNELGSAITLLAQTEEAEGHLRRTGKTPILPFPDLRALLARVHAIYALSMSELLRIAAALKASRSAKDSIFTQEGCLYLNQLAGHLISQYDIESEIRRCILGEEEMADNASPTLADLRRRMRQLTEKVREKLNAIIKSTSMQKYLQDPIITMRNGRYAIPVKAEHRGQVPGQVQEVSGSGQTLFVEPAAVVELGNQYKALQAQELAEIERILAGLTALIAPFAAELSYSIGVLAALDAIFAKAAYGRSIRGVCPKMNDGGRIFIKGGRHPLINPDKVVPVTLRLGDDFDALIITGPNTGGKTVSLKTVGLFCLLAACGIFIPAEYGSELSVFDEVYADIGDEQSIAQSLSTFSSHMTNIVHILATAGDRSLVLLDELGAGTDPVEGAALAQAILEYLQKAGAKTMATTHYSEIKAFALARPRMQNASMEFDVERLAPTYRLFIGIPGKSNAFEISARLGLGEHIVDRARAYLKKEDISFEDVLAGAQEQRKAADAARLAQEEELKAARILRDALEKEQRKLSDERERLRAKAKEDARLLVQDTKKEMDALITELRQVENIDTSALDRAAQKSRDALRKAEDALYDRREAPPDTDMEAPKKVYAGQRVYVTSIGNEATVLKPRDSTGVVQVQAGIMKMNVPLSDLRIIKAKTSPKPQVEGREILTNIISVKLELDLRGMMVEEALTEIDRHIDQCLSTSRREFYIVHGKGTGALRAGVQDYLRRHPKVKSFRIGQYGEGDAGVTAVTLRSPGT